MRIVVQLEEALVADVICGREAVQIGSAGGCRVRLDRPDIPPQAAHVYPEISGGWVVEVLNPQVGVHLNGAALNSRMPVHSGDELQIGDFHLRVFPEYHDAAIERGVTMTTRESLERFAATQMPPGTVTKKSDEPLELPRATVGVAAQLGARLAHCTSPPEFIDYTLASFFEQFGAQRIWIGLRRVNYGSMEYVEGRFVSGETAELPPLGEQLKTRALERSLYILVPRVSGDLPVSILAGPLLGPDGPLGMIYLDSGDSGRRFGTAELDAFVLLTTQFAAQLSAIFRNIARNRQTHMDGAVAVAHDIQARLTPRKLPQWDELQFGAFREPGRERTGDIYDVVKLANNLGAFFVAHTPAIGSWPSMLMAQIHAAFRCACMHQDTPQIFLRGANWLMFDAQQPLQTNCFMGAIDPASGALRYGCAGDVGGYIIGARGEERRLGGAPPPPPLGAERNTDYAVGVESLARGETLVVFTPGVTTAQNRMEEVFGEDRFLNILGDGFGQHASNMLKEMFSDLRSFTEGGKQPDDITVLLAHRM